MAKTYNTISTFTSGQVLTAAQMNEIGTNVNNYRVPPSVRAVRTSALSSYTSGAPITWQSDSASGGYDEDAMWDAGDPTKITFKTAGIYTVSLKVYLTCTATLTSMNLAAATNALTSATTTYVSGHAVDSTVAAFGVMTFTAKVAANDYMTFGVFPKGGSAYIINGAASDAFNQASVSATWIGQAS
jgi:hypothetical protein